MVAKSPQGVKDHNQLKHYWTKDPEGLAKWADKPDPYTALEHELEKYIPTIAHQVAAKWFHDVFGFWPGSDKNRVAHGHPPRGKVVGPG